MSYTSYGTELFGGATSNQDTYREAFKAAQQYRAMLKKEKKHVVTLKDALDHVGYVKIPKHVSARRLAEIERSKKIKVTLKEPFKFTRAQKNRQREDEAHYKLPLEKRERLFEEKADLNKIGHHIRRHQNILERVNYSDANIKKFKRIAAKLARGEKISKKSREFYDAIKEHFHFLGGEENMPLIGLSYMPDHAMLGSAEIYGAEIYGAEHMPRAHRRHATRRHNMAGAEIYGAEIYGAEHMPHRAHRRHATRKHHMVGSAEIYG